MATRRNQKENRPDELGEKTDLELALGLLRSQEVSTQTTGAELLGRLGPEGRPAIPHLVELLFSETVWDKAANSSRSRQCVKLRRSIIGALGEIGHARDAIVPRLLTGLLDKDVTIRRRVTKILRLLGEGARDVLETTGSEQVVALALSKAGHQDEDLRLRCNALAAVGDLAADPKSVAPRLLAFLKDELCEIRRTTMTALASFGEDGKAVWRSMIEHLSNESDAGAWEAAGSLVHPRLLLSDELSALMVAQLMKGLANPDEYIRQCAANLLGEFGVKAIPAVPQLIKALRDDDLYVPDLAAKSLGQLGSLALDAVPALIEARKALHPDDDLRYAFDQALKEIDPRSHYVVELTDPASTEGDARDSQPCAIRVGGSRYKLGDEVVVISKTEDKVLGALVSLGAASKQELIAKSKVKDAPRCLKRIVANYPLLAPYIFRPGKKNQGGYRTTIKQC